MTAAPEMPDPSLRRFSLAGRVAVVTGAAGLLGRRHCQVLAEAGASVVAVDLEGDQVEALSDELRAAFGAEPRGLCCDVAEAAEVRALGELVLSHYGRVDVLVNNAGLDDKVEGDAPPPRFEDYPLALWERSLRVNVTATFLCCQVLGGAMASGGRGGSIVNIASTYGVVAPDQSLYRDPGQEQRFWKSAAYPTSKGAVIALTRFLAAYWGARGVRVNALSPGGVQNGQGDGFVERYRARTPLGRMARPDDYQGGLLFLASHASAYVTGANLMVDGGFTAW